MAKKAAGTSKKSAEKPAEAPAEAPAEKPAKAKAAKVDFSALTDNQINVLAAQNAVGLWDPETGNARSREEMIKALEKANATVEATS